MSLSASPRPHLVLAGVVSLLFLGGFGVQAGKHLRQSHPSSTNSAKHRQIAERYAKLPLQFEANRGQADRQVKFISRGNGQTLFLTANEAVLKLQSGDSQTAAVTLTLAGANRQPRVAGLSQLPGKSNYFLGNQPSRWRTNVPNYEQVRYDEVYPGIDLVWHGNQRRLEHDFILAPGADPHRIKLAFTGAQSLRIDEDGALALQTGAGELKLLKPEAWQETNGQRQPVTCDYAINQQRQVGFRLGQYDPQKELVIDPVLLYSSFLGGSGFEQGSGVALDKDGNIYIAGISSSNDFPGSSPIQDAPGSPDNDVFIVKLNPSGSAILYGTWLGGANTDLPNAVAVDQAGNAYVTGWTFSQNFPTTNSALQRTINGATDAFVAKINAAGSALAYSTYLGGTGGELTNSIALDSSGNAYLAGSTDSRDLPATGFQTKRASSGAFKTGDGAANWSSIGGTLNPSLVRCLAVDANTPGTLYAGSGSGVFKSTDGGATWTPTNRSGSANAPTNVQTISIDPTNSNVLYVGTQFSFLLKSTDGGNSYTQINQGIPLNSNVRTYYDILVDPVSPNTLYLGTNVGAFKSLNGGATWTPMPRLNVVPGFGQPLRVNRLVLDPSNRLTLYAATNGGLFKTMDGGEQWTAINTGLGLSPGTEVFVLAVDPATPKTLYAGVQGFQGGLFKSTDGGATWRAGNTGLVFPGTTFVQTVNALAIDPAAPNTLYAGAGSSGIFKTTDGGVTWNLSNNGITVLPVLALALDPRASGTLYVGVSGGGDAFAAKLNAQGTALDWLTYLGGAASDDARGIALDKDGNVYLGGSTTSTDFPTANPLQANYAGNTDAYVVKLNPTGSALLYASYFGGGGTDGARSVAVNQTGQIYLAGTTTSSNLPTRNALQPALNGFSDAFVAKFNAGGSALEYATYLGGGRNENVYAFFVDGADEAYLTGDTNSADFPLRDAVQPQFGGGGTDAFIAKFNRTGSALVYSTYVGGNLDERGAGIVANVAGNAYVVGDTRSQNFPTVTPLQSTLRGFGDAFLLKIGVEADLAITQSASRNPVMTNNLFNYTLTVVNKGLSPATGVVVTNVLPAGVLFNSAFGPQGSCAHNAGTVTCNVGNLALQDKTSILLRVVAPTVTGVIGNTASVRGNEPDDNPTNNQAAAQTTISAQPSIFGRVGTFNGTPLPGVTINLSGSRPAVRQSNDQGAYQFADLTAGRRYTVTPSLAEYSFEPPTLEFFALGADQEASFTATPCTYSISAAVQNFPAAGGSGTFNLTAPPRCPWRTTASDDWITIHRGVSGDGRGEVSFTVAPTTASRNGRLTVGGRTFTIYQSFSPCDTPRFTMSSYPTSTSPTAIEAADFDGDGMPDLAVSSDRFSSDPLTVLRGEGNGYFSPLTKITSAFQSTAFSATDVNSDGRPDLLLLTGNLSVHLNQGRGRFAAPVTYPTFPPQSEGRSLNAFSATDFNQDGKPDVVVFNNFFSALTVEVFVLLNNGRGEFHPPIRISLSSSNVIGVADINGDGNGDLLAYAYSFTPAREELRVFLGDGFGSFRPAISSAFTSSLRSELRLATFGDFNGDGRLDAAALGNQGVYLALGDGTGRFTVSAPTGFGGTVFRLSARDFNGDGKLDLAASGRNSLEIFTGDGAGKLTGGIQIPVGSANEVSAAVAGADFDGDGKFDLATTDYRGRRVSVFTNRCVVIPGLVLAGRVFDRDPQLGFANVTVGLTGSQTATTQTDGGGNFLFAGLASGGTYTVAPVREGVDFAPPAMNFNSLSADQEMNFVGTRRLAVVSAATYLGGSVAADSIVALFGKELSLRTEAATSSLPYFLGGSTVGISPSASVVWPLPLFFASPNQVNVLMPSFSSGQTATIRVTGAPGLGAPVSVGAVRIERVVPGLFTADAGGRGPAVAIALRVKADGTRVYEPVTRFDSAQNKISAVPIDLSDPAEQVFLLLFGTGFRHHNGLAGVTTKIAGAAVETLYAGAQEDFDGLDQLNLRLPHSLAGRGIADITLTVDGKTANTVQINIK